uniref:DUF6165 family protein n=1 Tax=Synechococcus sp. UW106 TaxID=368495 RepID=UPI000E0E4402|nr:DUF6165 family protein [Synechococcus sp. UW106]
MTQITVQISLGELIDKITILRIKKAHMTGSSLKNVEIELNSLEKTLTNLDLKIDAALIASLSEVNQNLWEIEDNIRLQEQQKHFGSFFIELARSVYQKNDLRASIKREINLKYGSRLIEEKSYPKCST